MYFSNRTFFWFEIQRGFFAGYSLERINPGDKEHRLPSIIKVTSGTHKASSIKVAEAAKVIENSQRDLNIALINELAVIFKHLNIDTEAVLLTAGKKWNFLPFRPA